MEAERSALEECLAVTSVSSSAAPPAASMSLQPAPVTPQPHRNANPPSNMSDGERSAKLLTVSMFTCEAARPPISGARSVFHISHYLCLNQPACTTTPPQEHSSCTILPYALKLLSGAIFRHAGDHVSRFHWCAGDKQPEKAAVLLALTGREGSTTPPNSTTPDKTAPAAAVAPPSQAPPAAKQAAQPAKQSSPPSAQAMPSSTIVTPVGEESQKRKRPQEDDGTDPNPSSAAPGAPSPQFTRMLDSPCFMSEWLCGVIRHHVANIKCRWSC